MLLRVSSAQAHWEERAKAAEAEVERLRARRLAKLQGEGRGCDAAYDSEDEGLQTTVAARSPPRPPPGDRDGSKGSSVYGRDGSGDDGDDGGAQESENEAFGEWSSKEASSAMATNSGENITTVDLDWSTGAVAWKTCQNC